MLIPVKYLLNGLNVTQTMVPEISYFHVELLEHDVLLAEGLPVESYLDTGDRVNFDNGGVAVALYPDFAVREALGYCELIVTGPRLEMVRRRLEKRARPARRTIAAADKIGVADKIGASRQMKQRKSGSG
jgi:hypothetical protein